MALTDKLTNIANAIRQKGGTTEKLTLDAMPTAISALSTGGGGGVDIPDEAFVISGDCSYWAYHGLWDKFIIAYANKWSTSDITDTSYMFSYSKLETIPFEINCISRISYISSSNMYAGNSKLIELSAINNLKVYNISFNTNDNKPVVTIKITWSGLGQTLSLCKTYGYIPDNYLELLDKFAEASLIVKNSANQYNYENLSCNLIVLNDLNPNNTLIATKDGKVVYDWVTN